MADSTDARWCFSGHGAMGSTVPRYFWRFTGPLGRIDFVV